MARSTGESILSKTHARLKISKGTQKARSSITEAVFRRGGRIVDSSGPRRPLCFSVSPKVNRTVSKPSKQHASSHFLEHRRHEGEDSNDDLYLALKENQGIPRFETEDDDVSSKTESDLDENTEDDKQDWLDGSTLIAQYQDAHFPVVSFHTADILDSARESETEGERALALVDYLQVPMQEKFHELKRDLCNGLVTTMNDIRQAHIKIDRGADVDRGTGIVHFNDACDSRHVNASRVQAQLKDTVENNQIEIKKLFVQLKQAYDNRKQLWVDLQARIVEITSLQEAVLDQLDDNMARTVEILEKKHKAMLKDNTSKDKEKLLRGVLGRL